MKAVLAPTAAIHALTFVATNSGPLSDYELGWSAHYEQVRQGVDHIGRIQLAIDPDRKRLLRELVDDVQGAENPPVMCPILDEIIGPDVVGAFRPQPDA